MKDYVEMLKGIMVFNPTFNNMSVISCLEILNDITKYKKYSINKSQICIQWHTYRCD
jgi:hypothetical protein